MLYQKIEENSLLQQKVQEQQQAQSQQLALQQLMALTQGMQPAPGTNLLNTANPLQAAAASLLGHGPQPQISTTTSQ